MPRTPRVESLSRRKAWIIVSNLQRYHKSLKVNSVYWVWEPRGCGKSSFFLLFCFACWLVSFCFGWLCSMQDLHSPTWDQTLAVEARSLNHWNSRDVPGAGLDEWWGQKQGCSEWSRTERWVWQWGGRQLFLCHLHRHLSFSWFLGMWVFVSWGIVVFIGMYSLSLTPGSGSGISPMQMQVPIS